MYTLTIMRHGRSNQNAFFDGERVEDDDIVDAKLHPDGIVQVEATSEWERDQGFSYGLVCVSSMRRTIQSAEHSGSQQSNWQIDSRLVERDNGDLEGIEYDAASKIKRKQDALDWRPQGGETIREMRDGRVAEFLSGILPLRQSIKIITHHDTMLAFAARVERIPDDDFNHQVASGELHFNNASLLMYRFSDDYRDANSPVDRRTITPWHNNPNDSLWLPVPQSDW